MTAHAALSASGMYRWGRCPGSIKLVARLVAEGLVDDKRVSSYAHEGTGGHELGERCLRTGAQPEDFVGQWVTTETVPQQVTVEMAEAVQVYVDYVRSLSVTKGDTLYFIEATFDLSHFYLGMFGTTDCAAYHLLHVDAARGRLQSNGQGVPVEAIGKPAAALLRPGRAGAPA